MIMSPTARYGLIGRKYNLNYLYRTQVLMRTLVLNTSNVQEGSNNSVLVYNFPNSVDLTGALIAVSQIFMYYSWDNISASFDNNRFSYVWIEEVNGIDVPTTYTVIIPDGLYEIADINSYLQFVFIQNGHYLVNDIGQNVYYIEFVVNPNRYAVQINTYPVPTALPGGWLNPSNITFPLQEFNPQLTIPTTFNKVVGFIPGFQTDLNTGLNTSLSYLSSQAPQVQPNSNLFISITGIDNKYASPTSLIYSLAPNVGFGELIVDRPSEFNWNRVLAGTYNQLRVQFLGTDLRPINIKDPQMTIILALKDSDDLMVDVGHMSTQNQQLHSRSGFSAHHSIGGTGLYR